MTAFDIRLGLTEALARMLRGEEEKALALLDQLIVEDDASACEMGRRLRAAAKTPLELAGLASELGLDVLDYCLARLLEAYQDLDWTRIVPWEAAVMASGDRDAIYWMALVDHNAGRYQRSWDKLGRLSQTTADPEVAALRAACLRHLPDPDGATQG